MTDNTSHTKLSRREFTAFSTSLLVTGLFAGGVRAEQAAARSGQEISQAIRSGEVNLVDYVTEQLERAAALNGDYNLFISLDAEAVLARARELQAQQDAGQNALPLFGVPISIKDLVVTEGIETTFGTALFKGYVPEVNAPLVERLLDAGAIIFGKNNANELAYGSNGYNSHYGQTLNPYDRTRIAGGSSGGGAAAVAAGLVPIAIGSDTAASIRVPAAFNGLYGLRPTHGRYDNSGVSPIAPTLDTVGPIARSIGDVRIIDEVLSDDTQAVAPVSLDGLRVGLPSALFMDDLAEDVRSAFGAFVSRLREQGVVFVEADLQEAGPLVEAGLYPILFTETWPAMTAFLAEWGDGRSVEDLHAAVGPDVRGFWDALVIPDAAQKIPQEVYEQAIADIRPKMQKSYEDYFKANDVDVMLFPATASTASSATPENRQEIEIDGAPASLYINDRNSGPGALAGTPGLAMPIAMSPSGMPIGASLDGPMGSDRLLIAIAAAMSAVTEPIPEPSL